MSEKNDAPKDEPELDPIEAAKPNWFSAAQRKALSEKFVQVMGSPKCELCGHTEWAIGTAPVSPVVLEFDWEARKTIPSMLFSYQSVLLNCKRCGNSKMLQLNVLGFDPYSEPKE